ncbi:hypothetical protein Sliba_00330 [Streptomyces nigrescens]|uniref:Uncharacterized protein n=1 Tax=Streptomyces nigrescens TaxID=1920 RepID=A0A640T8R5_STRNI|nr:hypothetical protein Sliba_00330 [Streptomyces libani subsp. libani]GGW04626.1 hypothetical protein GCM10010500_67090 [Streptomyces libani subsp. libani]
MRIAYSPTNYPRSPWTWLREGIDQRQHRAAADTDPENVRDTGTGTAGERETDLGQCRPQPFGPPTVAASQPRDLLGERPPSARGIRAGEPPDVQTQHHPPPRTRKIGGKPQIRATHAARPGSTARAQRAS